jgi:GH25 family lysozyme M1 (1,4-beta-N-acetylmuramidase)
VTNPLIVDTYAGDLNGHTDMAKLIAAGQPWCGWMGKATQGDYYFDSAWFQPHWRDAKELAGDRYGNDWFRGAYHYLDVRIDAQKQAEFYLRAIQNAGGWSYGDLWPVVDVERAGQREGIGQQQVIDCCSRWANIVHEATGQKVILYGGSFLRDLGVTDRMSCSLVWVARYTSTLPVGTYASLGWTIDDLFAWQYVGDGFGALANYPLVSPIGKVDISAVTIAQGDGIKWIRNNMCVTKP